VNATVWCESLEATVLPYARLARAPDWNQGRDLVTLFERFTGGSDWDRPAVLEAAYERHNAAVRATVAPDRLLVWRASEGWAPICAALHAPVPDEPFPWVNTRAEWGPGPGAT
jgi:hypothetical protein